MRKKLLSLGLVLIVLISCCAPVAQANEVLDEEFYIVDAERHQEVERLFELRASLEPNFENNAEEIAQIDMQLKLLGVEEITYDELPSSMTMAVGPRVTPRPRENVKYFHERVVTVYFGQQIEVQIMTSVPTNKDSELMPTVDFSVKTESQKAADNIEFCTTAATGLIGFFTNIKSDGIVKNIAEQVIDTFSLYDLYSAYNDAISPTTVVYGVDCSGKISLSIHERHVFVKYYGSPDEGYQILGCISNRVAYLAKIYTEGNLIVNGVSQPAIDEIDYEGIYYSKYYGSDDLDLDGTLDVYNDREEMLAYVVKAFWEYRNYGKTDFLVDHRIKKLTFDWAGEETVSINIPYFAYNN